MALAPSPSSGRGEIVLQPAYFTSSVFVHAARADIDRLVCEYTQQYTREARSRHRPFTLFKDIWQTQGWTWLHFKVFDARSRAAFLSVVMRLFSERMGDGETPLSRVAALFGLYTLFRTQPSTLAPTLYCAAQVEVTRDLYEAILTLPDALDGEFLDPVRAHAVHVQSDLLQGRAFHVLPHAEMHPLSPRVLPRDVVVREVAKKRGRPSKRDRTQKARDCLVALEGWCGGGGDEVDGDARGRFLAEKSTLLTAMKGDVRWETAWREANGAVVDRMIHFYSHGNLLSSSSSSALNVESVR